MDPVAYEAGLKLLICCQTTQVDSRLPIRQCHRRSAVDWIAQAVWVGDVIAGYRARNQPAVIPPIESYPWFKEMVSGHLVLNMRGLVEPFVMVDAERVSPLPHRRAGARGLRRKEARRHRRHHHKRTEVMKIWHIRAQRKTGNLRVVPVDRKRDGGIAQYAKVKGVVGVLPNVVTTEYKVLAGCLLETGVELVAETRLKRSRHSGSASK